MSESNLRAAARALVEAWRRGDGMEGGGARPLFVAMHEVLAAPEELAERDADIERQRVTIAGLRQREARLVREIKDLEPFSAKRVSDAVAERDALLAEFKAAVETDADDSRCPELRREIKISMALRHLHELSGDPTARPLPGNYVTTACRTMNQEPGATPRKGADPLSPSGVSGEAPGSSPVEKTARWQDVIRAAERKYGKPVGNRDERAAEETPVAVHDTAAPTGLLARVREALVRLSTTAWDPTDPYLRRDLDAWMARARKIMTCQSYVQWGDAVNLLRELIGATDPGGGQATHGLGGSARCTPSSSAPPGATEGETREPDAKPAPCPSAPSKCPTCKGEGLIKTPCDCGADGCVVPHWVTCPSCKGRGIAVAEETAGDVAVGRSSPQGRGGVPDNAGAPCGSTPPPAAPRPRDPLALALAARLRAEGFLDNDDEDQVACADTVEAVLRSAPASSGAVQVALWEDNTRLRTALAERDIERGEMLDALLDLVGNRDWFGERYDCGFGTLPPAGIAVERADHLLKRHGRMPRPPLPFKRRERWIPLYAFNEIEQLKKALAERDVLLKTMALALKTCGDTLGPVVTICEALQRREAGGGKETT